MTTTVVESRERRFEQASKLHQILEIALEDYRTIRADERYEICMGVWHEPQNYYVPGKEPKEIKVCKVCLAGTVIANTLKTDTDHFTQPEDFDPVTERKLDALNHLRCGEILDAYLELYGGEPSMDVAMHEYPEAVWIADPIIEEHFAKFEAQLEWLLGHLRKLDI